MTKTDDPISKTEQTLWDKVRINNKGCWLYTGSTATCGGYGALYCYEIKRNIRAHRYSWEVHFGDIPKGMLVCHTCDVPACVNPAHLFLGTHQDNMRDMCRKGRKAKVTWLGGIKKDIPEDLMKFLGKVPDRVIAKKANVNPKTVMRIRNELGIDHFPTGRPYNPYPTI